MLADAKEQSAKIMKPQTYRGDHFTMVLHPNSVVELTWSPELSEVNLEMLEEMRHQMFVFGGGQKLPIYISTKPFMSMTDDARKFVGTEEGQTYTLANATLVDNLAKRILYNFFVKFTKVPRPIRAFKTREEALDWLVRFVQQND